MRRIKLGFLPEEDSHVLEESHEYESLGARIRNAMDQGVQLPNSTPLAFDSSEDGDQVDPLADVREDFFSVAERLHGVEFENFKKQHEAQTAITSAALSKSGSSEEGE